MTEPGEVTVHCEFAILGMDPRPGTMSFRPTSDYAWFVSDDGRTRTLVHRQVLAQADIEWRGRGS